MNRTVLKFTSDTYRRVRSILLENRNENHLFLMGYQASPSSKESAHVFLVDKIVVFNRDEIHTSPTQVKIDSDLVNEVFRKFVESDYQVLISCHSHPFETGDVWFSSIDDANDRKLFAYFYDEIIRHKPKAHMATMVFGQHTVAARTYNTKKQKFDAVERIVVLDTPIIMLTPTNAKNTSDFDQELYDRQILAFGESGQKALGSLKVTLIGAGGTGSIAAEALVRLGVKQLTIVDGDRLEKSNLNRWQGGRMSHVGSFKSNILAKNIKSYAPDIHVKTFTTDLFHVDVFDHIKDSDLLIGTVDSDIARYVLNKLAVAYMIPYMDCSSGITVEDGHIKQLAVRNVCVVPSITQCFECEDVYYDKSKFVFSLLPEYIRDEAKRRNYIHGDKEDIHAPSVYPINMLSVSLMMLEIINLFSGYKEFFYENTFLNYVETYQSKPISWNAHPPSDQCIDCNDRLGLGDSAELLSMLSTLFDKE